MQIFACLRHSLLGLWLVATWSWAAPTYQEIWLEASLNQQPAFKATAFLRDVQSGRVYVPEHTWQQWQLKVIDSTLLSYDNHRYIDLSRLPNITYHIRQDVQRIDVQIPTDYFYRHEIPVNRFSEPAASAGTTTGMFFNYDLSTQQSGKAGWQNNGLFEAVVFTGYGIGSYRFVGRSNPGDNTERWLRLDTTWIRDEPAKLRTWRFGDSTTPGGSWQRSVNIGGVQLSTNFATQPYFVTNPLPAVSGEAVVPSTVDIYVNNMLLKKQEVPPGPFTLNTIPTITGSGTIRLVTTDILGRQQEISVPYYSTSQLLYKGLRDYSYQIGFVRNNLGIHDFDYGRALLVAKNRYGVSDYFTQEWHVELLRDQQTAGVGGLWLLNRLGVLDSSLVVSRNDQGFGHLAAVGWEYQTLRWNLGLNTQLASQRFTQLGLQQGELPAKRTMQVFAGISEILGGSLGASYLDQENRSQPSARFATMSYNVNMGRNWAVALTVSHQFKEDKESTVLLSINRIFDARTFANAQVSKITRQKTQTTLQLTRELPTDEGIGYNLQRTMGVSTFDRGQLEWQTARGVYGVEVEHSDQTTSYRLAARGGVAMLGGGFFMNRRIDDSFAVVETGYPGVRVYSDNLLITRTNRQGRALIPSLRPYERNIVGVYPEDLPLSSQFDQTEREVVPSFRSGVLVDLKIRQARTATLNLYLASGNPVPAGAVAMLQDDALKTEFPVAYEGQVYVAGLQKGSILHVRWPKGACTVAIDLTKLSGTNADLGQQLCKEVAGEK